MWVEVLLRYVCGGDDDDDDENDGDDDDDDDDDDGDDDDDDDDDGDDGGCLPQAPQLLALALYKYDLLLFQLL